MTLSGSDKIHVGFGFCDIDSIGENMKYAAVFPYGAIEMFTEKGLAKAINGREGDEDGSVTCAELQGLDKCGERVSLSGPFRRNSDPDGPTGIRHQSI